MSSIWHTKKEKPMEDKLVFAQHKSLIRDKGVDWFIWETQEFTDEIREDVIAWAFLDDLLALETKLERTRKALDVAVDAIKSAKKRLELINNSKFANLNNVLQIQSQCEVLKINKALEQITALEQKDK